METENNIYPGLFKFLYSAILFIQSKAKKKKSVFMLMFSVNQHDKIQVLGTRKQVYVIQGSQLLLKFVSTYM